MLTHAPRPHLADVVHPLRRDLGPDRLFTDPDQMPAYLRDRADWAEHGQPIAVVRPRTTAEVQAVVEFCAVHRIPIVPRGAGTGLAGGANAIDGCVVLSLDGMDAILEINPAERLAVVQPGVVNDRLRAACAERGMWYPPDPASAAWSTIGGNVATNAGGMCCVKYGVTGDYVLGLEAVVGTGQVVRLGRRTAKGVMGYDLRGLLVGSEGTLGVITEVTVRLRPARAPELTVVGHFDSLRAAGEAISRVAEAGLMPSALELVDQHCLRAVAEWQRIELHSDASVLVLGRTDAPGAAGQAEAVELLACFDRAGAIWSTQAADQQEAERLFAARRLALPAMQRLGTVLVEDVCVPRLKVPQMLGRIEEIARETDTQIANIAHAGDGNLHPLLVTTPDDQVARARAQDAFERIIDAAVALGGTASGEHGVGLLKRGGLRRELSPEVIALHHAVKQALDPTGIFNPGKAW